MPTIETQEGQKEREGRQGLAAQRASIAVLL
jgi:hypothetical protein